MLSRSQALVWTGVFVTLAATLVACGGSGGGSGSGSLLVSNTTPADGGIVNPMLPPNTTRSQEIKIFFSATPNVATVLDPAEFNGLSANVRILDRSLARLAGWAFVGGIDGAGRTPEEVDPAIDPAWAAEIKADSDETLRFIYDTDGALSTAEALPMDQYTMLVTDQVTNKGGRPILEPFCGSFTSGPDTYAPVVRFVDPPDGATNVSLDSLYTFEFNEGVVESTVIGNPPATAGAVTLTAVAVGGTPGGNPTLTVTGTTAGTQSNTCRYVFTPDSRLPGSSPGASVVVTGTIAGTVRDTAGNGLGNDFVSSFTMAQGPTISNNPMPPNALWYGSVNPDEVGVIAVNPVGVDPQNVILRVETDGDGIPTAADENVVIPSSVNREVGQVVDIVLGDYITKGTMGPCNNVMGNRTDPTINNTPNPNPPMPMPLGSSMNCFPTACGNLLNIGTPNSSNADLGTYIYVADTENNVIRILNGNTSLEIDQLPVPDPAGIALTGNLENLLVSNFSTNSVSVFDVVNGNNVFIKEINVNPTDPSLAIGRGPGPIAGQPDSEDVCVINRRDESMSIMSVAESFEVRKVVATNIGPDPVHLGLTWRQPPFIPFGGTGTWFAYITNRGGDSISVYESGPTFPVVTGPDDIRIVLTRSNNFAIRQPTRVHTDLATGIFGDGVFYVNSEDGTVGHLSLSFIGPPPSPYFPNPAPNRVWAQIYATQSFGNIKDLAMGDNIFPCTVIPGIANFMLAYKNNFGQILPPIKGYVATGNGVRVFDAITSLDLGININVPGVTYLAPHWKQ